MTSSLRSLSPKEIGLIFDVDGIFVDSPHEKTWGIALERLFAYDADWRAIRLETTWRPAAYKNRVYRSVASGRTRFDAARGLMAHFQIPHDEKETRLHQLAEMKHNVFLELMEKGRIETYEDAIQFALEAKANHYRLAIASASVNAAPLLAKIPLPEHCLQYAKEYKFAGQGDRFLDIFEVSVCARDFERGKPAPDVFLGAAAQLGIAPNHCIVFEDSVAGVKAAKAGGMKCIGVARKNDAKELREAGADRVLTKFDDLYLEDLQAL